MSKPPRLEVYTEEQYRAFSDAVDDHSSQNGAARIRGRLALRKMDRELSREVMHAMWSRNKKEHGE